MLRAPPIRCRPNRLLVPVWYISLTKELNLLPKPFILCAEVRMQQSPSPFECIDPIRHAFCKPDTVQRTKTDLDLTKLVPGTRTTYATQVVHALLSSQSPSM